MLKRTYDDSQAQASQKSKRIWESEGVLHPAKLERQVLALLTFCPRPREESTLETMMAIPCGELQEQMNVMSKSQE
ncbi:hypothetical protein QFC20_006777 [Naganishia adeliensis]|uniref:Uncharacterized protein n=1 Tax=Naganishia adeliensis TaxID=92952 RepID=A0ACC2V6Z7_9TREE|nr:hypothetical protein QFC20_006777 [Naganishia adeliensis]